MVDGILRQSAFPVGSTAQEQRELLRAALSAQPLPADLTVTAGTLGGVPTAEITIAGIEPRHVVLYFHGGVYVIGDAFLAADLASQVGRRVRAKVISVDYRLAPEHPYPAAVDDALAAYEALLQSGVDASNIVFAGESAGGGLAVATLINARDHGLPLPAAAFVMSPMTDLTLAGTTMETRREADPLFTRELLQERVNDYTAGQDAALPLMSPIFADLAGLPPLIIQAGRTSFSSTTPSVSRVRLPPPTSKSPSRSPLGYPTSSKPIPRSSTKGPRRWTEPDSSCRRISPAQNASLPESHNPDIPIHRRSPVTVDDPRASWEAAQEAIFDEIRTYGRPKTGYFAGQDVLLLETKGAKSGEHRVSPLTFTRDGERLVVVASKGGAPTNPAWFANLVANPIVTVESGGEKFEARATPITAGPERDRLYAQHASTFPGFLEYERQTSRTIPVVLLERNRSAIG